MATSVSERRRQMAVYELPEETLIDIFSRLPTKSVGQCRCLSKQWFSILSSEQFIKSHLTRKPHQESLILITRNRSIHSIDTIKEDAVSRELQLGDGWTRILGSCDGLVLLENKKDEKFLVNPTTLQQKKIPNSPLALKKTESFRMYGLGYDSSTDDYKIVALSYDVIDLYQHDNIDMFVDVYSVKRGVWKRVKNSPYVPLVYGWRGTFLNGAVHWMFTIRELGCQLIVAFDLVREVFVEILPPPDGVMINLELNTNLAVLKGCLCMIDARRDIGQTDIWIMEPAESWTKFSLGSNAILPLCYIGNDKIVLITKWKSLAVYNVNEGTSKEMVVDGVQAMFITGETFVESLVSPDSTDN